MNKSVKEIVAPIAALGGACLIITALLAVTNFFTAPIILKNETEKADSSRKIVLAAADTFSKVELTAEQLKAHNAVDAYAAKNGAGYTVTTLVTGYHGDITAMFGIDAEGKIAGLEIITQSETQGLGERISGKDWQGQFIGKSGALSTIKNGKSAGESEIVALSGATISSNAMTTAANSALEIYEIVKGGAAK